MTATTAITSSESESATDRRPQPKRLNVGRLITWFGLAIGTVAMFFPIYWLIVTAFIPNSDAIARDVDLLPDRLTTENFSDGWSDFQWTRWYRNSIFITVMRVGITVPINLLAGYTFAKFAFRGSKTLFFVIIATLTLPIQVILVPRFLIVNELGLVDSPWGVILPFAAEAFGIFFVRQFMVSIPDEILEAARIDGASEFRIFREIVVPLSKPAIGVLTILTFLWTWNNFAWPLVVLTSQENYTVTLGLNAMQGFNNTEWSPIMAMATLSLIPVLLVFLLFQKYFVQGIARTGIK